MEKECESTSAKWNNKASGDVAMPNKRQFCSLKRWLHRIGQVTALKHLMEAQLWSPSFESPTLNSLGLVA